MVNRNVSLAVLSLLSFSAAGTAYAAPGVPTNGRISFGAYYSETNDESIAEGISSDGRFVAYTSLASNIGSGDANATFDVYRYDRFFGVTLMMSVATTGAAGNGTSYSVGDSGRAISADGRYVLFNSDASDLVPATAGIVDSNNKLDAFLRDTDGFGSTQRVSLGNMGVQIAAGGSALSMSSDAQKILFTTTASLTPQDANVASDLYVYDRVAKSVQLASARANGSAVGGVSRGTISDNGRWVAFETTTALVPQDTQVWKDVYYKDLVTAAVTLVSTTSAGVVGTSDSYFAVISPDGAAVAFSSNSNNFLASGKGFHVYLKRISTGVVTVVTSTSAGNLSFPNCGRYRFSASGTVMALSCTSSSIVTPDTNGFQDVFTKDFSSGIWTLVSKTQAGIQGNAVSELGGISGDGSTVVIGTKSNNFVSPDANNRTDVFVGSRL